MAQKALPYLCVCFHLIEGIAAHSCCGFNYIQNSYACILPNLIIVIVKVSCRSCNKTFATNSNGNKHERSTRHGSKDTTKKILFDSKNGVYLCLTENCKTYASTKRSIKRHLKNCNNITKNRKKHEQNKICKYCQKRFHKKFKRERHVKQCHSDEINDGGTKDFVGIDLIIVKVQPD